MTRDIVYFPIKNGGSFHSYVKLLEGTSSWCGPNTVTNRESQRHATSGRLRSCDISGLVGVPFLPADVPHLPFAQIAGDGLTRRFKRPDNTRRSTKLSTLHINSIRHIYYGNLWYMIIMIIMIWLSWFTILRQSKPNCWENPPMSEDFPIKICPLLVFFQRPGPLIKQPMEKPDQAQGDIGQGWRQLPILNPKPIHFEDFWGTC
jgi:hypothetical protein